MKEWKIDWDEMERNSYEKNKLSKEELEKFTNLLIPNKEDRDDRHRLRSRAKTEFLNSLPDGGLIKNVRSKRSQEDVDSKRED